ncbi:MAG: LrgB family protein [Magnetospirillum sp.]|nr:LrgB family protein [Magnetospirillum sp.]
MTADVRDVWTYLADTPLLGLTATLIAWDAASWIWRRARMTPLLNPVLLAIVMIVIFLSATGIDYRRYFAGAQFIHFLLGPATVALAIPLYRQIHALRRSALAVTIALAFGSVTAAASAVGIAWALGASRSTILSLAPKSATTPIAMGIAKEIGGLPSLTAVLVLLTGIVGATMGPWLLAKLKVADPRAQGLALGVASHGIGTARALQSGEVAGAFSGLAMGLNGLATAILVPLLVRWLLN